MLAIQIVKQEQLEEVSPGLLEFYTKEPFIPTWAGEHLARPATSLLIPCSQDRLCACNNKHANTSFGEGKHEHTDRNMQSCLVRLRTEQVVHVESQLKVENLSFSEIK
jgi:hypothetical protein